MAEAAVAPSPDARHEGFELTQGACDALLQDKDMLNLPGLQIQPLRAFLQSADSQPLTQEEKDIIVEEATFLIGKLYPHLPFKEQLYTARPLEMLPRANASQGERDWHASVIFSVSSVLDAHTLYGLPSPYVDAVAFLPFELQVYWDRHQSAHFVVTRLMNTLANPFSFGPGCEILSWNGCPADVRIPTSRGEMPSGNHYARIRRGALLATVLPLRFCEPPPEDVATLLYIPARGGDPTEIHLPWSVATRLGGRTRFPGSAFSVNRVTHVVDAMKRVFVRGLAALGDLNQTAGSSDLESDAAVSLLPHVFEFQYSRGTARPGLPDPERLRSASLPDARFGYIRIKEFSHDGTLTDAVVDEFRRILEKVMNQEAPDGLVIDIRGNPGGDIEAAESLLQMLTSETISPLNFHLANTPTIQDFLRGLHTPDFSKLDVQGILNVIELGRDMRAWIDDVEHFDPNSALSPGHPITSLKEANAIGRIYQGKCALLVDALSYSAADIFAAGFQDHEIGPVIGSDATTGGGGASVWSHRDLANHLVAIPNLPDPTPLPREAAFSVAISRAMRVRKNAGIPIEDAGVKADVFFAAGSAEELLNGSQSIVQFACDYLTAPQEPRIAIRSAVRRENRGEIEIESSNLDFVQIYVNRKMGALADMPPGGSPDTPPGVSTDVFPGASPGVSRPVQALSVPIPAEIPNPAEVHLRGGYLYRTNGRENFVFAVEAAAELAS